MSDISEKMNPIMDHSYLVQRLLAPMEPGHLRISFGGGSPTGGLSQENFDAMNTVCSFDYMGAAEFEFGALRDALNKMIASSDDLVKGSLTVHWIMEDWKTKEESKGDDKVYFICHKEHRKEIKKRIKVWAQGKQNLPMTTKCLVYLNESFKIDNYKGWFELDNGFFFFIDKEMWKKTWELFRAE